MSQEVSKGIIFPMVRDDSEVIWPERVLVLAVHAHTTPTKVIELSIEQVEQAVVDYYRIKTRK